MTTVSLEDIQKYGTAIKSKTLSRALDSTAKTEIALERHRSNYVDIDGVVDIIYKLFQDEGYSLSANDLKDEAVDNTGPLTMDRKPFVKFKLIEHHPESRGSENTQSFPLVSVMIFKRSIASNKQGEGAHRKEGAPMAPRLRVEGSLNPISGEHEEIHQLRFDNTLELIAWSTSAVEQRKLAKTLEHLFIFKFQRKLRANCTNFAFLERGRTIYTDDYGQRRMFGVPIFLLVQTEESMLVQEQPINEISVTAQPI